jgi:NAD(P)-dependent dehydrogenase (short-subunit alcohol dehydrogenase family)
VNADHSTGRRLEGRVAIVTGASKGIGQALACGLANHGAAVIVNYKNDEQGAAATVAAIREAGAEGNLHQADISEPEEAAALVDATIDSYGRVDILVNNAGRTRFGPATETTLEDWDDVVDTNLRGTYFTTVTAARHMLGAGSGSIINISSCAATLMVDHHSLYTMSKGGVEALTRQLALELAPQLRVNAVAPAPTSTERNKQYDSNYDANWGRLIPLGRVAQPNDFIGPVVFLASDESGFITGEILHVDGGWSLRGCTPDLDRYDYTQDRLRG